MQSVLRLTTTLLPLLLCGACAGSIQIATPAAGCSSIVPERWGDPVPSAAFPPDAATIRDWQVFGVEQTGQLARSNGRTADVIEVVRSCEARDAEAVRQITAPWWRRLWPG